MKAILSLTHNCNLNCPYCYSGKKFKKNMSFATGKKAIDFAMGMAKPHERLEFGFFGGEPLLQFDLIRKLVAYIRHRVKKKSNPIDLNITTNGTLLTPEILEFIRQENIGLCISIDGPREVHDRNRKFNNGVGSFATVIEKIELAKSSVHKIQVNAVYDQDNINTLADTVKFLIKLGIGAIHVNPNISTAWDKVSFELLEKSYNAVAELYIDNYRNGREVAINLIDNKVIVFLKKGYDLSDRCGMGETEWGIASSGNIYPCERFIGGDDSNEFCLGNVDTGLDGTRRCRVLKRRGNHNAECATCSLQKYCMNWCGCTNFFMTGDPRLSSTFLCLSEKASIKAANHVLNTLKEENLFLDHFYRYLVKGRQCLESNADKEKVNDREN